VVPTPPAPAPPAAPPPTPVVGKPIVLYDERRKKETLHPFIESPVDPNPRVVTVNGQVYEHVSDKPDGTRCYAPVK
jgi:hypothetical protein